jgi:hypothetical protein
MKKPFLTILVIAVAVFGIGLPQTASAQIGAGSCVGIDACLDGPTIAGDDSCIGDEACFQGPGEVGTNTCVGGPTNCDSAQMTCPGGFVVRKDPHNGCAYCPCPPPGTEPELCPAPGPAPASARTCYQAGGPGPAVFGDDSCGDGFHACQGKVGGVGSRACNGDEACLFASAAIGDCEMNTVVVAACAQSIPSLRPFGLTSVAVLMLAAGLCATRARRKAQLRH